MCHQCHTLDQSEWCLMPVCLTATICTCVTVFPFHPHASRSVRFCNTDRFACPHQRALWPFTCWVGPKQPLVLPLRDSLQASALKNVLNINNNSEPLVNTKRSASSMIIHFSMCVICVPKCSACILEQICLSWGEIVVINSCMMTLPSFCWIYLKTKPILNEFI